MARRSRSRGRQRDPSPIATRQRAAPTSVYTVTVPRRFTYYVPRVTTPLQTDLRRYYPDGRAKPANRVSGRPARITRSPSARGSFMFDMPAGVLVCVRRKRRKQVLFALQRTGKGARAPRRRNQFTDVRC